MKETTKTYNESKPYVWDGELEVFLALFTKRLEELRGHKRTVVSKEILEKYVRLKPNGIVGATPGMRKLWGRK